MRKNTHRKTHIVYPAPSATLHRRKAQRTLRARFEVLERRHRREELPPEARKICGCDERDGKYLPDTFKDMPKNLTARECMQGATAKTEEMTKLPLPPRISGTPPDQPNGYTDGSYVNPTGHFWSLGGGLSMVTEEGDCRWNCAS